MNTPTFEEWLAAQADVSDCTLWLAAKQAHSGHGKAVLEGEIMRRALGDNAHE